MYGGAFGVQENRAESAKWYRYAADMGDPESQAFIGNMFASGFGVSQNLGLACAYSNFAFVRGYARAGETLDWSKKRMKANEGKG
jgi:TPR repeat protein